jgi:hypothetical protein
VGLSTDSTCGGTGACPAVADGTTAGKAVGPIEELRRAACLRLHEEEGKQEEGD